MIIGGLVAGIGAVMPWISVTNAFMSVSKTGMDHGRDGLVVIALAALVVVVGLVALAATDITAGALSVAAGLVIAGFGVLQYANVAGRLGGVPEGDIASVGFGICMVILGGVVTVAGSLIAFAIADEPQPALSQ